MTMAGATTLTPRDYDATNDGDGDASNYLKCIHVRRQAQGARLHPRNNERPAFGWCRTTLGALGGVDDAGRVEVGDDQTAA
jgi:hypothetical protein